MKPKRKLSPRSFVTQVAGSGGPIGQDPAGQSKAGPASDHDLGHPPGKSGAAENDSDAGR